MQEELTYTEKQPKTFEEVSLGDIANDSLGVTHPVIDKGTLRGLFDKWGHRSTMGLQDVLNDDPAGEFITEDSKAIAVLMKPHPFGDVVIFPYSNKGAEVYK